MCLAVPMKIVEMMDDGKGVAELDGSRHVVDLSLIADARLGSYVIVHAGYAIETLDQAEADATLALFAEIVRDARADAQSHSSPPAGASA